MTRKKTLVALSLLVTSFMGLLLISCDQQSPQHGSQDKGGTLDGVAGRSTYLFSGILKTPDLKVKANDGNGYELGTTDRTALLLQLSGDICLQFSSATSEEFKRLAEKIGDLPKEEGYVYATPMDNLTTASSIAAVEIKALTPYDDAHPAGSSLKDLVRIKYQSFDHVFDQTLKPTTFGSAYHAMYTIEPAEDFTPIKHPALIMGHYSEEKGLYMDGLIMSVEFTKAPQAPHQQLEITLSFDNGLKLKKEIAIDILELKK